MGAFIVNFHVRTEDSDKVRQALEASGAREHRVTEPRRGWVSVYEQRASTQEEDWITKLSRDLSQGLKTVCVAFLVHDSDIACYWLHDGGKLLDEYNSAPDYFEEVSDEEQERVRGQADVFLRYCRSGVTREQVEAALRMKVIFAEEIVGKLAELLGIDPEHAQGDFRGDDGGWGDDGEDGGNPPAELARAIQQRFGNILGGAAPPTSPENDALVQAAATGNIAEIDRLVQAGANVNAPGMMSLAMAMPVPAAMTPKFPTSPLLAAASKGQAKATQRLLELGANVQEVHPMFGSPLHAAAQCGSAETVQVLLAAGVPADVKNAQGLTPRKVVEAVRQQLESAKTMIRSMPQFQAIYDQLLARMQGMNLSESGWDACDELLRKAGG
jgi:ankyrin repeat protein